MKYSLEYLLNGSLDSEEGDVKSESAVEGLLLKLDAEKYVSLVFSHVNSNMLTVSGGQQKYVVMFLDSNRFYELVLPENKGDEPTLLRTGHTVGKFPAEMVADPFTTLRIIKEFYRTGKRLTDLNWKALN